MKPPSFQDSLSDSDLNEWRSETAQITPYEPRQTPPDAPTAKPRVPPNRRDEKMATMANANAPAHLLEVGRYRSIDRATATRIRRGKMPPDRMIDLHGLTVPQAYERLMQAVQHAHATGGRMMLVITGKGRDGQGVLRQKLPHWVNEPALRGLILAIQAARPQDGGEGAFYLLLKRSLYTTMHQKDMADKDD